MEYFLMNFKALQKLGIMDFYRRLKKLEYIHQNILNKSTSTPSQLARKAGIARRTLYEYLEQLRNFGADIKYSRTIESFYYVNDFDLRIWIRNGNSDKK